MGKRYKYIRYFILLAVLTALFLFSFLVLPKWFSRPQALTNRDYAAQITPEKTVFLSREGERFAIKLKLKNIGQKTWSAQGKNACLLSYHVLDAAKNNIRFDNTRYPLPQDIGPNKEAAITINLISPFSSGKYLLEFDLLREGISWFKNSDSGSPLISLTVNKIDWPDQKATSFSSRHNKLNSAYKMIRLTLEVNQAEFKGTCGNIAGFSPGVDYPQIWIRDASTILPASRFFYPLAWLNSWLEEFLCRQSSDGSIEDWIDSRNKTDKNTTASDQETSLIQAAYQVFTIAGPGWLQKSINQKKIIDRLEAALEYLIRSRSDTKTGLFIRAHTADWGDVDITDKDLSAVYSDDKTIWTAGIYDQAMFYQAALQLAEMLTALEHQNKAAYWSKKADSIKNKTNKWLWQEDKGFYLIHLHITPYTHNFAEEDIFALGGNTQAILSGLADNNKCARIIATALERKEKLAVSTISGTLLPPYPARVFRHALLDSPYEYQNGGQWDWFGNKLVYAMFSRGFSRTAAAKLFEILDKNTANLGLFEWENREGSAQGSANFCGTAGSLGLALFRGYFGIIIGRDSLSLEPKLGVDSSSLHIYQPANGLSIDYEYRFDQQKKQIHFAYKSSFTGSGMVKILVPAEVIKQSIKIEEIRLLLDRQEWPFQLEKRGNDTFLTFPSDFNPHTAEIMFNGQAK